MSKDSIVGIGYILELLDRVDRVSISFNGGFSSSVFYRTDKSYLLGIFNKEQERIDYKLVFKFDTFRANRFIALNDRKLPDLSDDKNLD